MKKELQTDKRKKGRRGEIEQIYKWIEEIRKAAPGYKSGERYR